MSDIEKLKSQRDGLDKKIAAASIEPLSKAHKAFTSGTATALEQDLLDAATAISSVSTAAFSAINNASLALRAARDTLGREIARAQALVGVDEA